ncbi:hypothetical protein [Dysgonomonas macrotermitis]|uniref:Uncharacterized protein n=1 Tax=Dysgonomonas macrotermitis TaxID=1346286 RepID=A0A1M5ITR0_9BACT|nr:hypothetical protein [Dysgonomonas macrotermitis]SHG31722.1 hypothetical protein SAMN05444362_12116 [Dysgonomonas macrotermitis]
MTEEKKVIEVLEQREFSIQLGGETVYLRPATLSDMQQISALTSDLPIPEIYPQGTPDHIALPPVIKELKYSKTLAEIISISAVYKSKLKFPKWIKSILNNRARKKVFELAYREASIKEIHNVTGQLFLNSHVFFYQDCITILKGINQIKPTKETDQTALG